MARGKSRAVWRHAGIARVPAAEPSPPRPSRRSLRHFTVPAQFSRSPPRRPALGAGLLTPPRSARVSWPRRARRGSP